MKKRIAIIAMLLSIVSSNVVFADTGVVNASSLNVRQKHSLTSSIICSLPRNTKINTLGKVGGFYKLNYKGKIGYVYSYYIKIIIAKPITKPVTKPITKPITKPTTPVVQFTGVGTITVSSLNVRTTASMGNNTIGAINPTKKVNIYGMQGDFYKIRYYGQWGYICKSYVMVVNAPLNTVQYIATGHQSNTKINTDNLMLYSNSFLGMPYLWGGTTPAKLDTTGKYVSGGFDCSGFVQYIYKNLGVTLPRTTFDQIDNGVSVCITNLKKGDLVFFRTNSDVPCEVSHVGLYIGDNKFIHSPHTGDVIKTSELTGYYEDSFIIGKRIVKY